MYLCHLYTLGNASTLIDFFPNKHHQHFYNNFWTFKRSLLRATPLQTSNIIITNAYRDHSIS